MRFGDSTGILGGDRIPVYRTGIVERAAVREAERREFAEAEWH
jgi:hypothetical protein